MVAMAIPLGGDHYMYPTVVARGKGVRDVTDRDEANERSSRMLAHTQALQDDQQETSKDVEAADEGHL